MLWQTGTKEGVGRRRLAYLARWSLPRMTRASEFVAGSAPPPSSVDQRRSRDRTIGRSQSLAAVHPHRPTCRRPRRLRHASATRRRTGGFKKLVKDANLEVRVYDFDGMARLFAKMSIPAGYEGKKVRCCARRAARAIGGRADRLTSLDFARLVHSRLLSLRQPALSACPRVSAEPDGAKPGADRAAAAPVPLAADQPGLPAREPEVRHEQRPRQGEGGDRARPPVRPEHAQRVLAADADGQRGRVHAGAPRQPALLRQCLAWMRPLRLPPAHRLCRTTAPP